MDLISSKSFDIAIIGNGIIGSLTALEVSRQFPDKNICLIGEKNRHQSASVAAGAMHAVFGEVEEGVPETLESKIIKIGLDARKRWIDWFGQKRDQLILSNDSIVYLQSNPNIFEKNNFNRIKNIAKTNNCLAKVDRSDIPSLINLYEKPTELIKLKGEFSICVPKLFEILDEDLKNQENCKIINTNVISIDKSHKQVKISTASNPYFSTKIIVCAGSNSKSILKFNNYVQDMFQGVGTAIALDNHSLPDSFPKNIVIRTANRGGANCGIHIIPRSDGTTYLGAGNYIIPPGKSNHRIDSIRYLINMLEKDLIGLQQTYPITGTTLLGSRPRSFDGFPLIGELESDNNIFLATGTNRVGLTWAPTIVVEIIRWLSKEKPTGIFDEWHPERSPISFGSLEFGLDYFVQSRISNFLEHKLIQIKDVESKTDELVDFGFNANQKIISEYNLPDTFCVHPDLWGPLSTRI